MYPDRYHRCPSCGMGVRYGMSCCGNPLANMFVIEGILDDDPTEILMGEAMGFGMGFGDALLAEEIMDDRW